MMKLISAGNHTFNNKSQLTDKMRKNKTKAIIIAALCIVLGIAACSSSKSASKLAPAKKGYAETGKYRNYLKELGFSQEEIDGKIQEIYSIIFEGDEAAYHDVDVEVLLQGQDIQSCLLPASHQVFPCK